MELAILGAGCAGSSLAYMLAHGGFTGGIHLFDARADFPREQRWCSWGPIPDCFSGLVSASWPRWKVTLGDRKALCSHPERPYLHVHAPEFYRRVHEELSGYSNVHLHLGTGVRAEEETEAGLLIRTSQGTSRVDLAFDSRTPAARDPRGLSGHIRLRQSFAGRMVRTQRPAFDPQTATLMDFGIGWDPEISFTYVLPFETDRALVESTTFSREAVSTEEHYGRVERYLERQGLHEYEVESEESGALPMTTEPFPTRVGRRRFMIGAAGGATRPSSGYAFVPIMRQSEQIADALIRGGRVSSEAIPRKYRLFDAIFLDAIDRSSPLARESFLRMFERVPPDSLVRFLSGESTLWDDLRLTAALSKTPFVRAALRRAAALSTGGDA